MNVLGFVVVVALIMLVITTVAKMIVEATETFDGTLSFFILCVVLAWVFFKAATIA